MEVKFSRIIQGCMGWGSWGAKLSTLEIIDRMNLCISEGITTFDHADIYGDYTTEAEFGKALEASGIERESIELITKCGIQYVGKTRDNTIKHYQYDADYIVWSAEKSIKDLNAEYLDLFLLHRPSPLIQSEEVAKAVDKLKSEGKIRAFGLSNFTPSQTQLIQKNNLVEANQIEFSLTANSAMWDGSLDHMQLNNITPMCWSPLGGVFKEDSEQSTRIHSLLEELSEAYNATKDQLLLAWILKHPAGIYPVIGTSNRDRITSAAKVPQIELTEIDWFRMLVESQGHKVP